jgi:hypothetical protein
LQFFSAKNVGSETGKLLLKLQFLNAQVHFSDIKKGTWEVPNMTMHITIIPFLIQLSVHVMICMHTHIPMFKGLPVMLVSNRHWYFLVNSEISTYALLKKHKCFL